MLNCSGGSIETTRIHIRGRWKRHSKWYEEESRVSFDDGGSGHEPRNAGGLKVGEARAQASPTASRRGEALPTSSFQPSESISDFRPPQL